MAPDKFYAKRVDIFTRVAYMNENKTTSQAAKGVPQPKENEMNENERLATLVRQWRGKAPLAVAGPMIGLSPRTMEGIEQGRGFRNPKMLEIAIEAVASPAADYQDNNLGRPRSDDPRRKETEHAEGVSSDRTG